MTVRQREAIVPITQVSFSSRVGRRKVSEVPFALQKDMGQLTELTGRITMSAAITEGHRDIFPTQEPSGSYSQTSMG